MAKIYDFTSRKSVESHEAGAESDVRSETPRKGKQSRVDKETYLLWMFSRDIDTLMARYMFEHNLKVQEIAAILSHRLGGLVATTENPERLEEFCQTVMRRMALVDEEQIRKPASLDPTKSQGPGEFAGQSEVDGVGIEADPKDPNDPNETKGAS
jgi:hypothetical protein